MPEWMSLVGPGAIVAGITVIGTIITAKSGREQALPEHFDRELRRLSEELDKARARIERLEAKLAVEEEFSDALEEHIRLGRKPPPPKRPAITSIGSPNDR